MINKNISPKSEGSCLSFCLIGILALLLAIFTTAAAILGWSKVTDKDVPDLLQKPDFILFE